MKKHFVEFLSPGTFFEESTTREIDLWDVEKAIQMSKEITERYNATPYGFRFITRERTDSDFDSREVARSGTYYLGGDVYSLEDLVLENDPSNSILISNMRIYGWKEVVINNNSWKWTQPLMDGDVVLEIS